jgi:putative transcriptional regulator
MKLDEVHRILETQGYEIFPLKGFGFDIVAKKRSNVFLKISENINSVKAHIAQRMRRISWFFDAKPYIIGDRRGDEQLLDAVVYQRYSIPAVNVRTFEYILNGEKITAFSERGGIYCDIKPGKIDVGFAPETGVTKRCVYYYKSGEIDSVKAERAGKLKKLFGDEVLANVRILDSKVEVDLRHPDFLQQRFSDMGFKSISVHEHIADVLAGAKKEQLLTKTGSSESTLQYYADRIKSACRALNMGPVFVISRRKTNRKFIKDIPVISMQELKEIKSKDELFEAIKT